jgi:hypothetical protein
MTASSTGGQAGVEEVVVNLHHKADQLSGHLARRQRPRIRESREETLLETGGGVRRALPLLGGAPFFVVNGDVLWRNGKRSALDRLAAAWDESRMDGLLLLQRTVSAVGYDGRRLHADRTAGPTAEAGRDHIFAGQIPSAPVRRCAAEPLSLNRLYATAVEVGRPAASCMTASGTMSARRRPWPSRGGPGDGPDLALVARRRPVTGSPRIFSIPAGVPFVDALAEGMLAEAGGDPLRLAEMTVLLPTRRAGRALREAFLRHAEGRPLLLPRMTPLGDVDADELVLAPADEGGPEAGLESPQAIGGLAASCCWRAWCWRGARPGRRARPAPPEHRPRPRRRRWPANWPACSTSCRPRASIPPAWRSWAAISPSIGSARFPSSAS